MRLEPRVGLDDVDVLVLHRVGVRGEAELALLNIPLQLGSQDLERVALAVVAATERSIEERSCGNSGVEIEVVGKLVLAVQFEEGQ